MRQTLFLIPHEIAGLPLFGVGWLLLLIASALVIRLLVARRSGNSVAEILRGEGVIWVLAAAAVALLNVRRLILSLMAVLRRGGYAQNTPQS